MAEEIHEPGVEAFIEALQPDSVEKVDVPAGALPVTEVLGTLGIYKERQKALREQTVTVPVETDNPQPRAPWPRARPRSGPLPDRESLLAELRAIADEEAAGLSDEELKLEGGEGKDHGGIPTF